MCILFWTVDNHPKYRFIFAGNRDEFLKRPTARAHFWKEPHQHVLAGTDLEVNPEDHTLKNGTWLGITKEGRFAALTNYREPKFEGTTSRGVLVRDFLWGSDSVKASIEHVKENKESYGGFSVVFFDFGKKPTEMSYYTNRENQPVQNLNPGVVYGLSNSVLTNSWPKVDQGKSVFYEILKQHNDGGNEKELVESLLTMLSNTTPMKNENDISQIMKDLKETVCVPKFNFPIKELKEPTYATKTSTVVLVDYEGNVTFVERDWFDENLNRVEPNSYNDVVEHFQLSLNKHSL